MEEPELLSDVVVVGTGHAALTAALAAMLLACRRSLRISELLHLRWDQLDFTQALGLL